MLDARQCNKLRCTPGAPEVNENARTPQAALAYDETRWPDRKFLYFNTFPMSPLGTLDPLLKEAGFRIRYVNLGRDATQRPSLDRYAALIVLGGPMNADEIDDYPNLRTEVELLKEALQREMSILGICLGAQLLGKALCGAVAQNELREIGWHDVHLTAAGEADPVLSGFAYRQRVFQWQEDGIELPPDCTHLAHSAASRVQAFRFGEHAYGLQFHLEVDSHLIECWLSVAANQPMVAQESGRVTPEQIREQVPHHIDELQSLSRETFGRWIDRFDAAVPRRRLLPSR